MALRQYCAASDSEGRRPLSTRGRRADPTKRCCASAPLPHFGQSPPADSGEVLGILRDHTLPPEEGPEVPTSNPASNFKLRMFLKKFGACARPTYFRDRKDSKTKSSKKHNLGQMHHSLDIESIILFRLTQNATNEHLDHDSPHVCEAP